MEIRLFDGEDYIWKTQITKNGIKIYQSIQVNLKDLKLTCRAFGLPFPIAEPIYYGQKDSDCLSVKKGASVNCNLLKACFHSSGTHTECVGHIVEEQINVLDCIEKSSARSGTPIRSLLVTLDSDYIPGEDSLLTEKNLRDQCAQWQHVVPGYFDALIVRGLVGWKKARGNIHDFTGTNPPYFESSAITFMTEELQIQHLVVDLPSIDREESSKDMPNHSLFFGIKPGIKSIRSPSDSLRLHSTITELAYLPYEVKDGPYLLLLQVASINMDAAPSSPVLFPVSILPFNSHDIKKEQ